MEGVFAEEKSEGCSVAPQAWPCGETRSQEQKYYVGEDGCCGLVSFFAFSIPQVGMACMDNLNYDQYIDHLSQVNN